MREVLSQMRLLEIVPGDMIDAPFWPGRVTVMDIVPFDDGYFARVFWTSPEAEGVTWLSEQALVRCVWDFRSQGTRPDFRAPASPVRDAVTVMTLAQYRARIGQPVEDEALATLAAQMRGE